MKWAPGIEPIPAPKAIEDKSIQSANALITA